MKSKYMDESMRLAARHAAALTDIFNFCILSFFIVGFMSSRMKEVCWTQECTMEKMLHV